MQHTIEINLPIPSNHLEFFSWYTHISTERATFAQFKKKKLELLIILSPLYNSCSHL